jgi:thymidylate kinase
MHIELIGSTSAGKTTLAKKMVDIGKEKGLDVSLSDDFMLQEAGLGWVRNDFVRRRLVEAVSFAVWLTCHQRYREFFRFVLQEGRYTPGSWFYKINRIRNVIRKIGIFEFIARRRGAQQIVLADNEGILQGVHNLFVHQNGSADLQKISRYVEMVPLPDVVLYLQQEEATLLARTLGRGHARVAGSSPDKVRHFIKQAVAVFDALVLAPKIHERLLIVDGGSNIRSEAGRSFADHILQVTELVRPGLKDHESLFTHSSAD